MPPACKNASGSTEFFPEPCSQSLLAYINVPLGTPGAFPIPVAETVSADIKVFPKPGLESLMSYINIPLSACTDQPVLITCSGVTYA